MKEEDANKQCSPLIEPEEASILVYCISAQGEGDEVDILWLVFNVVEFSQLAQLDDNDD